jgi:lipoprotein-releasing system ATP-binding protein
MSATPELLRLEGVVKSFSSTTGERGELPVLEGIDLAVARNETVAIVGPSGSGKSTMLNIIGSLELPDRGRVLFEERELSSLNEQELAEFRNRRVGFVFQHHHLLAHCSALENVLLPTLAQSDRGRSSGHEERARDLLERVGLGGRLAHRPSELSGGERQRVAVVRALINEPDLLLADEPTGSLDRAAAAELGELLAQITDERALAMVVVTHSMALAASMQRRLELLDGRLESVEVPGSPGA